MKVAGIITEFNPFHKGHEYIISKAKEITNADYCIIITSGNFVQRGEPSFVDKYTKTYIALNHGADLVIELPVQFATASAEYFATSAITILNNLGIVDYLVFGTEIDDIHILEKTADILIDEPLEYKETLKNELKNGFSFPKARSVALSKVLENENIAFIEQPNNILGLEYIKALKKLNSTIKPIGIKRIKAGYHETFNDVDNPSSSYSASNIRNMDNKSQLNLLKEIDIMYENHYGISFPINKEKSFSAIAGANILKAVTAGENDYFDVSDFLWDKIKKNINKYTDFSSFVMMLKSKDISYSAISRALLHIVLNIKQSDVTNITSNNYGNYVRILGFKSSSKELLTAISEKSSVIILTKPKEYNDLLDAQGKYQFEQNLYADNLYRLCASIDLKELQANEFERKMIVI